MKSFHKKFDLAMLWGFMFLLVFVCVPFLLLKNSLSFTIACFALCAFIMYKYEIPHFSIFLFTLAFLARVAMVLIVDTPAESDFGLLLNASQSMIRGDYSFLEMGYFQLWSYQMGFVLYQSKLLSIWNNVIILKLANCLFGAGSVLLVYHISKEFVSDKSARFVSVMYCFFSFSFFYVTILTNQFSASFLIYLGVYILITKKIRLNSHIRYLIFAVILALADVLRPESVIPLLSAVILLVLTIRKTNFKENILNMAILVVVYFVLSKLISQAFIVTGVSPNGLTNNAPYWKLVLGLNHDTSGQYSGKDLFYLGHAKEAWELIRSRVIVPLPQLQSLFVKKITIFWSGNGINWVFNFSMTSGLTIFGTIFSISKIFVIISEVLRISAIFFYFLLIIGVFLYMRREDRNDNILLILNQIFITYGIYLFIEVQPRYAYHIHISVAILAALGISVIYEHITKMKNNKDLAKERVEKAQG